MDLFFRRFPYEKSYPKFLLTCHDFFFFFNMACIQGANLFLFSFSDDVSV